MPEMLIQVVAQTKAWVYGHLLAEIVGLNPTQHMDVHLLWLLCLVR